MQTTKLLTLLAVSACGGAGQQDVDAGATRDDARLEVDAAPIVLPSWMLEDVQPASPRAGQTYGLQTFSNKVVVVTLLEGF